MSWGNSSQFVFIYLCACFNHPYGNVKTILLKIFLTLVICSQEVFVIESNIISRKVTTIHYRHCSHIQLGSNPTQCYFKKKKNLVNCSLKILLNYLYSCPNTRNRIEVSNLKTKRENADFEVRTPIKPDDYYVEPLPSAEADTKTAY